MENLLKTSETQTWFEKWAEFLTQSPFYHGEKKQEIQNIISELCQSLEQGDSCLEFATLPSQLGELCHVVQGEEFAYKPLIWDAPYLYLQRYWALEHHLAQRVVAMLNQQVEPVDLSAFRTLFEDPYQQQALAVGVNSAFAMITGGPGTGKTYILTRIVAVLKKIYPEMRIAMAAPTGKAAQRMQEALQSAFSDPKLIDAGLYHADFARQQTQTLHRLLGMGNRQVPRFNRNNPLPYDVVVVDEASMLDLSLAKALFDAVHAPTRLILLGDANQLSSVDVGYVLADLHRVNALQPYQVRLVHSRRFSDDANIGRFARFINAEQVTGEKLTDQDWLQYIQPQQITADQDFNIVLAEDEVEQGLAKDWVGYYPLSSEPTKNEIKALYAVLARGYDDYIAALKHYQQGYINKQQLSEAFDRYRILVVMRYFDLGLDAVNQAMTLYVREKLNIVHEGEWFYGRPVMMVYNDYQLGLSNGDVGICIFDDNQPEQYTVYFPSLQKEVAAARLPQSIQTAFALTIHKSQGSEFRHTAVVLDDRAQELLSKELLYTAITRAKKMLSIYSSPLALKQSLQHKTQRKSGLVQQIQRLEQLP
ncbi:exodeoxyribonuclease V subunit alpha [Acinetobacter puyangensis]|uniref:exodeoxyribonuclease V subunit alpha n=1 Tax=Acinetobacter puyangensis TaxID=1096779 RepID=UPI001D17880E|nr:exodeoxyribonuclease V subunit alpha [Acinetobacter puyangensis]